MNVFELISLVVTAVGVLSFSTIFTILYRGYANSAVAELDSGKCDVELIEETILTNIKNSKRYRRILKRVKQILLGALIVLLIPFLALSVYSKVVNGVAMINGHGVIAVASGSMSFKNEENPYLANINNQFNTYDMIVLEKPEMESDIALYDVIAYVNDKGENIIHRVVGFQQTARGMTYITRGDSNNADDEYNPLFSDVLGKYTGQRIPYVGVFVMFLQSFSGILTVLAIIYCLIMIESVRNKIEAAREARLLLLQESIDFRTETSHDGDLNSSFVETVYFKNYAYTFDKNGFVSKERILEEPDSIDLNAVSQSDSQGDADADASAESTPEATPEENGDGEKL
jgi:signal peptidase I